MKRTMLFAVAALGFAAFAPAHADDVDAGKTLYQNNCLSCHGAEGAGQAIFPAVQGKEADFLTDKLNRYRDGETVGDNTALMAPHAANLSDDDIANVSAYMAAEFE